MDCGTGWGDTFAPGFLVGSYPGRHNGISGMSHACSNTVGNHGSKAIAEKVLRCLESIIGRTSGSSLLLNKVEFAAKVVLCRNSWDKE